MQRLGQHAYVRDCELGLSTQINITGFHSQLWNSHIVLRDQYYGNLGGSIHKSMQTSRGTYPQVVNDFEKMKNELTTTRNKGNIRKKTKKSQK